MPISKSFFHELKRRVAQLPSEDGTVPDSEVIDFLRKYGHSLELDEILHLLKEIWDVELGDLIIVKLPERRFPSGGNHLSTTWSDIGVFKLAKMEKSTPDGWPLLFIREGDPTGKAYSGDEDGSGIFHFFIDVDFAVLKNKKTKEV